ncbi:hypothetical protein HDU99_005021 [Rhizoclosmatium hyalinum]|nr:hypothetical protein HDU99_005021 [Rhizoclosmatium hyalinum]
MDDAELVKPFFESVFKYAPDPVTPAPLASRRSASTFTLVFSQKKDDVDVFFNQVRLHIDAVHGKVKTIVKDVDVLAGMQIDYATCLHDLDLLMADLSLHESLDPIASSYRKLCKTLSHLSSSFNSLSDFLITNTRPSLYSYRRSMEAMRVSLDARLVALDEYEDACKNGVKKQKDLERMQVCLISERRMSEERTFMKKDWRRDQLQSDEGANKGWGENAVGRFRKMQRHGET